MTVVAHVYGCRAWWHRGIVLVGLLCYGSSGGCGLGFFGRNPCRLARHRRGAASGWHLPFLKGVVATRSLLPSVCRGNPRTYGPGSSTRFPSWRCCLVLDGSALGACGGASSEGASIVGHRSLVDPLMFHFLSSFLFFGFVWVLLPQRLWCCVCTV